MIVCVTENNIMEAAEIHAITWRAAHQGFCSEELIAQYTTANQKKYLESKMMEGEKHYMLVEQYPVGIVSVHGDLIENLYILPTEQHKGYGRKLLLFAIEHCEGCPRLLVLENNKKAQALYQKFGFKFTGKKEPFPGQVCELEMKKEQN